jgi:hypothetical protein
MNAPLNIKPGVFYAACGGEGIVMDLVANRYFAVSSVGTRVWDAIERGLSPDQAALDLTRSAAIEEQDAQELVQALLASWHRDQLMTAADPRTFEQVPRSRPRGAPAKETIELENTPVRARAVAQYLAASSWYAVTKKRHGLIEVLNRLVELAPRVRPRDHDLVSYSIARAARFVRQVFRQGQPDCLDRSIVLAVALRWSGVDAELCLGVRRVPFVAHAWVEVGGRSLLQKPSKIELNSIIARF